MKDETLIALPSSASQIIRGIYHHSTASPSSPITIFAHGLGSTRDGEKAAALKTECARHGWAFAAFDFHGHGESDGTMLDLRGSRLIADLDVITNFIAERGHAAIYLVGSSMGGWATSWFAALNPSRVKACALIAPAFRFLEWQRLSETSRKLWQSKGRLQIVNEWIDLELDYGLHAEAKEYPFDQLIQRYQTPTLIVHGMNDDTIPYSTSIEFTEHCKAAETQLLLIKNGDHRLNTHKHQIARTICDFFSNQCP